MKSFFCRINYNKNKIDSELFNKSLETLTSNSSFPKNSFNSETCSFAQIILTEEESVGVFETSKYIICSDSRIDNFDELLNKLELTNSKISYDQLILSAFEKWGEKCTDYLIGDFAFAIWDKKNESLYCARDHFGVKPFFYYIDSDTFVFSSEIKTILSQTDLNFAIDEQYIADTISIVKSETFRTNFKEIKKLQPAHSIIFKDANLYISKYWKLVPQKTLNLLEDQIIDQFKELIIEAIRCRIKTNKTIGSELSGGIDSSTITAYANQFIELKTFSHVLPENLIGEIHPFKDEKEQISLVCNFCKISDNEFIYSEEHGVLDAIRKNLIDLEFINQQNFNVFSDGLYKKAEQKGISVLLSGFGGDEVVTSKSAFYLQELANNSNWKELYLDLKNQKLSWFKTRKLFIKYFVQSKIPFLYKAITLLKKEKPWWHDKYNNLAFNKDFAIKMNINSRYFSSFKKKDFSTTQDINIERITHPHVSQRLEYCGLAARKYGIEYRYPFLDKRLVEFYLSIPTSLKAQNGIKRYAIRKAIEGLLPKEIQWRIDKSGATIPTVFMRTLKDKDEIFRIIQQAKSNKRITKYIDLDKYEKWFISLLERSVNKKQNVNPGAFYNYLKLILYIEKHPELFNE